MANIATNLANFYSTTLSSGVGSGDLVFNVVTTVGGPASPCYIIIDPETPANREIILCDGSFSSTQFATTTLSNRDLDSNGNLAHLSGVTVWVAAVAQHFDDLNDRIDALVGHSHADYLPKAGGTMTGEIAMGTSKITGLGTPTSTTDAATKAYVDTAVGGVGGAATTYGCRLSITSTTVPHNTWTTLNLSETSGFDVGSMFTSGTDITSPAAGLWVAQATVFGESDSGIPNQIRVRVNGTAITSEQDTGTGVTTTLRLNTILQLAASDVVTFQVLHQTGSSGSFGGSSGFEFVSLGYLGEV